MKTLIFRWLIAVTSTLAVGTAAIAQERVIRIGALMPLSGPASYYGVQAKEGTELALEEVNKAGVNGYKLQVHYEDSACSPLQATNTVKRLLEQFKPHAVIAAECSDAVLAVAPFLEAAKVPLLNPSAAAGKLTESGYKYVFRIFPTAQQQNELLATHAYDKLKARTAVLVFEKTNAGVDNADTFEKVFKAKGGKVLARIDFGKEVADFTSIATRIASLGDVDVLPTFGLEGQSVRLAQALAQARVVKGGGGKAIQLGSIWLPWGFEQKAGQASEGYIRAVQFDPTEKRPIVQEFMRGYRAKYGADKIPTHPTAGSYDLVLLVAHVVRQGATDSEAIRDRFSKVKNFEGATGKITFGPNGQTTDLSVIHFVETQKDLSWKGLNW